MNVLDEFDLQFLSNYKIEKPPLIFDKMAKNNYEFIINDDKVVLIFLCIKNEINNDDHIVIRHRHTYGQNKYELSLTSENSIADIPLPIYYKKPGLNKIGIQTENIYYQKNKIKINKVYIVKVYDVLIFKNNTFYYYDYNRMQENNLELKRELIKEWIKFMSKPAFLMKHLENGGTIEEWSCLF
jgi:hypothetical protein